MTKASKWSRYKLYAQRLALFNVKRQFYISRRAQLPSDLISRKPPVTLQDYVNQTKLMELLKYELPEAEELGITDQQYQYLLRQQFKLSLAQLDEKKSVVGPRALKVSEEEVKDNKDKRDKIIKIILIAEQHLDPNIKVFLYIMHSIRSSISFQWRKVVKSERYQII